MAARSIAKEFPARAPEPMGQASALAAAVFKRVTSRVNASACARRKCESRIGCACCICVMPAMGTPSLALAWRSSALARARRPRLISDAASITKRRKSVATSSCPGAVYRDFVREQPAIECERTLKRVETRVRLAFEAASPEFIVFAFGHSLPFLDIEERFLASLGMTSLAFVMATSGVAFGLCFGSHGDGKGEEIDEAFGVFWVVAAHGKAGQIRAIKREGRFAAGDVVRALPEFQADAAGDALLRDVEKSVQRLALRREPHAVVNKFRIANSEGLLQVRGFAIDGQAFQLAMRGDQQRAAGSFVRAARLHSNQAVFHEVGAANSVTRGNFIQQVQQFNRTELRAVDGNRRARFETNFLFLGFVGSFFRRNGPLPHGFAGSVGGIFQLSAFVAEVPDVAVAAVNILFALLDGDVMLFGVGNGIFARIDVPLAPRSDDLKVRCNRLVG